MAARGTAERREMLRTVMHVATYLGGPLDGQQVRRAAGRWRMYRDAEGGRVDAAAGRRIMDLPGSVADRTIYELRLSGIIARYLWQADPIAVQRLRLSRSMPPV